MAIYLSLGLNEERLSYRRSCQPSKDNIQHFKTWSFRMQPTKIFAFPYESGFETMKMANKNYLMFSVWKSHAVVSLKGGWAGAARGAGASAGAHARARQGEGDRPRDCLRQGKHHRQVPLFRQPGLPHFGMLLSEGISFFYINSVSPIQAQVSYDQK